VTWLAWWRLFGQTIPTPTDPGDTNAVLVWITMLCVAALGAMFWQLQRTRDAERDRLVKTIDTLTAANAEHAEANVAATTTIRDLTAELVRERERRERLEERRAGR
jgi:uncharacterized protein HemX